MLGIDKKQFIMSITVIALAVVFISFQFVPLHKKTKVLKAAKLELIAENTAVEAKQKALPQLCEEIEQIKAQARIMIREDYLEKIFYYKGKVKEVAQEKGLEI